MVNLKTKVKRIIRFVKEYNILPNETVVFKLNSDEKKDYLKFHPFNLKYSLQYNRQDRLDRYLIKMKICFVVVQYISKNKEVKKGELNCCVHTFCKR